ncbi:sensor histidine kinase [Pseudoxanthomonas wuyuanensis]|uniref:Two-component system, NarL family, sensor histidine kinase DesK n=1 Tax=Pseudoxanthomonas wuyuanensis TaxID=1073196 RepID=A0A286D2B6_9GAMM|nr:sensor histidine kinase [Pseudoxanthomonas wuyuanensis]KAF1723138.1 sensor histidine kinase [Pseudoxanthomonas wuyuanensis]SOD52798.1 two-component system, NarL family, sensor histidine kinase DesK [Pseudoxanthomonas wuyuanensis]
MKLPPLPRWLTPQPDSLAAHDLRMGRSPWLQAIHLVWTVWVFLTPAMSGGAFGYTALWALLTLVSYPLFLWLYAMALIAAPRRARACALAIVGMCLALLPWYPSGLSYFVFGCVMLQPRRGRSILGYFALLAVLNAVLAVYARHLGYPWQALVWMPVVTAVVAAMVTVERINHEREAALKFSHDEVRRLAALAERERIGRDLHDLLGHTLSLVALKSDLAGRLMERDPVAARREIDEVSRVARDALAQVRRAVTGIRAAGLAGELASAKLLLESDGVAFRYTAEEAPIPSELETVLALTLREAVTNIQRHARASLAEVSLQSDSQQVTLHVRDNGVGGAMAPGNGLTGMRERVEARGGRLRIESVPRQGTCVEVTLPLPSGEAGDAPSEPHRLEDMVAVAPASR